MIIDCPHVFVCVCARCPVGLKFAEVLWDLFFSLRPHVIRPFNTEDIVRPHTSISVFYRFFF